MKTLAEYDVNLPDYSVCYLINDDSSGLDQEDINTIDNYMQEFYQLADNNNGSVIIDCGDSEPSFTWNPAFGLACNCFDATITILTPD